MATEERVAAAPRSRLPITVVAWTIVCACLAAGCADLALRQVARRPLLPVQSPALVLLIVVAAGLAGAWLVVLQTPRRELPVAARPASPRCDRLVVLALVAAFAGGLVAQRDLGARLQSDGFYYFAYLRSLWFDHDVDFANDYRLLGLGNRPYLFTPTSTGHAQSAWTIGPAIVWSPFFAAADVIADTLASRGHDVAGDGTSFPYRQAICVAGLFYGLLGVWFCYRLAALFVPGPLGAAAAAVTTAGSFMLWYLVKEPTMTHAPSLAAVAGFTYFWAATRGKRSVGQWALLGLLAGLATTVRWQNAIFALLPAVEAVQWLYDALRTGDVAVARRVVVAGLVFTASAVVGFVPQMLAWKAIYGSYLAVSPLGPPILWSTPAIVNILWSSRNGLLSTSPVLYLALLGLLAVPRLDRRFGVAALLTIAAMIYFNATILDWWGSASFGMRRFDGVLPLMTVGLAVFARGFSRFVARRPAIVVAAMLGMLVLWNLGFMNAAVGGNIRVGEPVGFGDLAGYQAKAIEGWLGYPFSYPANLLYAARYGVSPDRYDALGPGTFLSDPRQPYGKIDLGSADEAMLAEGWYDAERDGALTFRWSRSVATLLVPLHHRADLQVQLRVRPFIFVGASQQTLGVRVNGAWHGPFQLQPDWQDVRFDAPRAEWHSGLNRVVLEFGRENAPSQVGAGNDPRALAGSVDYLRISAAR